MKEKNKKEKNKKEYFIIRVEGTVPVTAEFRVFAEDPEKALEMFNNKPSSAKITLQPKVQLNKIKRRKATVKNMLTSFVGLVKNY